ncbi:histidinol-phosphate transaminase [Tenacibaculum finnmarkense]|uniref:histidinol-phosphate transaminase n=1 Tax=Tenacibaculum finnmarkense TaxID=2781243 RepID=UPI000C3A9F8C|nr:histidinol-phosphate transaminase [Tenacibaculum finnmarkense]MCD8439410.1 histidinol-phosphate transaminase [Tenacibaculum finnmarkense genomovar ulcerans]MCG8720259.1 histidinol-phosphate transaminase [Tenacibaculum finnmarkense]SOS55551.1 Histidinol-phosphate aminotransferase [Tenacibaculum finnmarkense]
MFNLDKIVRPNIKKLKAYSSARDEFKGTAEVYLDANENPFGDLNRYPDPRQIKIKERLSVIKKVAENQIFIGNGSDEVIDLAFRIFCEPGKDKALTFSPTYGMYDVSANINDVELIKQSLLHDFQINLNQLQPYLDMEDVKIIFICSPNNPTGNCFDDETIEYILENFNGVVLIDEAYIDFSSRASYSSKLEKYPNLIVSQTFSKAWGLAGVRVGAAYANQQIIDLYNKVKPPYNVSILNQEAVLKSLGNLDEFEINKNSIINEKETLIKELSDIKLVKKIYPTEANFILIEVTNANLIYNKLVSEKIIIRNRTTLIDNCLRITVGKSEENKRLITVLASLKL